MSLKKILTELGVSALAGAIATGPMTVVMVALHRRLPWPERHPLPPKEITTRLAKRMGIYRKMSQTQHETVTWLNHFGFGAGAGAIYGPLSDKVKAPPALKGALFGLLVWFASYLGWLPAAGILYQAKEQPARPNVLMIVAHLVWGLCLGISTDYLQEKTK